MDFIKEGLSAEDIERRREIRERGSVY